MSARTRIMARTLAAALALGVLGDALMPDGPRGAGFALWLVVVAAQTLWLARDSSERTPAISGWLCAVAVCFALLVPLRDSPLLGVLNMFALVVTFTLLSLSLRARRPAMLVRSGFGEYIGAAGRVGGSVAIGLAPLLGAEVRAAAVPEERYKQRVALVGRGALLALPALLVFGGLFMSADPVFADIAQRALGFDTDVLARHVLFTAVLAWGIAGYLRSALLDPVHRRRIAGWARPEIGMVEAGVILGLLNALFLVFVLVQLRYLFGGSAVVSETAGLTYAEYARTGFFQLVAVSVLLFPVLVGVHAMLRGARGVNRRAYMCLAGSLLLLLSVIMLSALQRMRLYTGEYGLTEMRLYATAFMFWVAVVFVIFIATVLRGRPRGLAFGSVVSGWAFVAGLNVLNPDAFIARWNLEHALPPAMNAAADDNAHADSVDTAPRAVDVAYLTGLSADAIPALVAAFPRLTAAEQCAVARRVRRAAERRAADDWRSWNLGYSRTGALVQPQVRRRQCDPAASSSQ